MSDAATMAGGGTKQARRAGVMGQLLLDAAGVEAVRALRAAGIRPLLFKGPTLARWLYTEPGDRPYGDIDLLVAPGEHVRAGRVIAGLGYEDRTDYDHGERVHASQWLRPDRRGGVIDLHRRITGTRGDDRAFAMLCESAAEIRLGDTAVETIGPDARTALLALHAAQHGTKLSKPLNDLERALEMLDLEAWTRAAAVADGLGASEAFATGLRLLRPGSELAARLGLAVEASLEVKLRAANATVALGLLGLLEPGSWRSRAHLLWRELVPSPQFMRMWKPLARTGTGGMAAAYAWRPLWLAWKLPGAALTLVRVRRQAAIATERAPDAPARAPRPPVDS
jgi:hypothetical protein